MNQQQRWKGSGPRDLQPGGQQGVFGPTLPRRRFFLMTVTCLSIVTGVVGENLTASGSLKSDFEAAWRRRRQLAHYARCSFEKITIIRANTMGRDYHLPEEDMVVQDQMEVFVDLRDRRLRTEGTAYVSYPDAIEQKSFVTLADRDRSRIFTVPHNGKKVRESTPTVIESSADSQRNTSILEPALWALGFLDLYQLRSTDAFEADRVKKVGDSVQYTHFVGPNGGGYLIVTMNPEQDFAVTSLVFAGTEDPAPDKAIHTFTVTSTQTDFGWLPSSWQMEDIARPHTSTVVSWDFFEDVPNELWEEPEGVRESGRFVYSNRKPYLIAPDQSLVPLGVPIETPTRWWMVPIVAAVSILAMLWFRQWSRTQAG